MSAAAAAAAAAAKSYKTAGDAAWAATDKVNAELFAMTYGAMVVQLVKDYKDVKTVNVELERMGYNIGVRLVDEFLAKSGVKACVNFKETANVIAKVAFKMFLGIAADVGSWREDGKQFSLTFKGNPMFDFVELPSSMADLQYGNMLCGVIRGALQMIQLVVECQYVKSELSGHSESEIRVTLKEILQEAPVDDEE